MFYLIRKESICNLGTYCVRMKSLSEKDYNSCVDGLGKMLSDDGMFIISEDEHNIYMKGVKQ